LKPRPLPGPRVNRRPAVILRRLIIGACVLAAGIVLRVVPGAAAVPAGHEIPAAAAEGSELSRVILGFYRDLGAGRYHEAFSRACEPAWSAEMRLDTNRNVEANTVIALTPVEGLVSRTRGELGETAQRLSIFDVTVESVRPLVDPSPYGSYQDVRLVGRLGEFRGLDGVYVARVSGEIFSTFCSHSRWEKLLVLVRFHGDPKARIFLNGSGNLVGIRAREWFLDRKLGEYLM
jgi:hypothetical protein